MNGWVRVDDNGNGGSISFVSGPATAPLGNGSARFQLSATNQGMLLATTRASQFSSITTLRYSTYRSSVDANNNFAASLQLTWDNDTTDVDTGFKGRLVYEPVYAAGNGAVPQNTWQQWDAMTGAGWYATNGTFSPTCSTGTPCTWAQVLDAWPDAGFHDTYGGPGFKAGSGIGVFDGNVDNFQITDSAGANIYDFEPETSCTTTCYVDATTGDDEFGGSTAASAKKTIQAAVDTVSSGGTIIVAAGTYAEHVNVDLPVTLNGANVGIDGNAARGAESIIDGSSTGAALVIAANNVVVNGFKITGGANGLDAGVYTSATNYGYEVKNNVITGNSIGMDANSSAAASIRHNLFDANNIPGSAGGTGIYSESTTSLTIDHNTFTNHTLNNPVLFASVSSPSHHNVVFTNNTLDNDYGIYVLAVAGGTFQNNDITATAAGGATALAFASGNSNVQVNHNKIHDSARGVRIDDDGYDFGNNSAISIRRNSITGNSSYGINVVGGYTGTLNAECNWYGSSTGPSDSLTPSGTGDAVLGNLDYIPWLTSTNLDGNCVGTPQAISLLPSTWSFGDQVINTTSATKAFTVKNVGKRALTIQSVQLGGTNPGHFGIDTNNCDSQVLAPNATCTILVDFSPSSIGPKSARLDVASNDADDSVKSASLSGNGTNPTTPTGNVTIVLDSHPNSAQAFSFTGSNGAGTFTLKDDGVATPSKHFTLAAGQDYVFKVDSVARWALSKLTCNLPETINRTHRTVAIFLTAGQNVICTFTESYRIADALIATSSGGPYSGDNVYSTSVISGQTKSQTLAIGQTKSFWFKLQNDGVDKDTFRAFSTITGSTKYRIWFYVGVTDVTGQVTAGTFRRTLASGAQITLELRVKALSGTPASAIKDVVLIWNSRTAPDAKDVAKAHISRS